MAARALIRIAGKVQLDRRAHDLPYPELVSACRGDLSESEPACALTPETDSPPRIPVIVHCANCLKQAAALCG